MSLYGNCFWNATIAQIKEYRYTRMWYQKLYKAILPLHFRSLFSPYSVSDTSGYISTSNWLFLKKFELTSRNRYYDPIWNGIIK